MRKKMINNHIQRTITELSAEIANKKLTDSQEKEPAKETNKPPFKVETPEDVDQQQQSAVYAKSKHKMPLPFLLLKAMLRMKSKIC